MADNTNTYASAQPFQNTVSDWMAGQERMDFAKREEDRQIKAIEEARKERERMRNDKLREKMLGMIPKNYDTGSSSLNQFQAGLIMQGVNRIGEITKELKNPNLNDDQRIALEIEAQNINNLPENLKIATDNFTALIKDYQEGVATGAYFRNPDFEKKVLSGFDNYVGTLDNGLPAVGFIDRDNDGQMDIMPYDNLREGIGVWEFQKQYDLDKMAQVAGEKLGSIERQTDSNFVKRLIKGPKLDELNIHTDNLMQKPDGSPTPVALSEMRKLELPVDRSSLEEVKRRYKERVLTYTDTSDKTDIDYSARLAAQKNAEEKAKAKEGGIGTPVTPTPETWGTQIKFVDTRNSRSVPVTKKLILPAVKIKDGKNDDTLSAAQILNYTYDKEGNLMIDAAYTKGKLTLKADDENFASQLTGKKQFRASKETESRIAAELGMSPEELRASATNPDAGKETPAERALRIANGG